MADKKTKSDFSTSINDFVDHLDSLRDFSTTTEGFLEKRRGEIFQSRAGALAPFVSFISKKHPSILGETSEIPEPILKKMFGGEFELVEMEGGGTNIVIREEALQNKFNEAIKEVSKNQRSIQLLRSNVLISLISAVEAYLSGLMHLFYAKHPDAIESSDKSFTLSELKKFSSIEDAQNYLIECKVEQLMRGSFEDWSKFFKSRIKLEIPRLDKSLPFLVEACMRRNVVIHNGGIVNAIYLNSVDAQFKANRKIGEKIDISVEYLGGIIDRFEACCLLLGFEMWKRFDAKDAFRWELAGRITYDHVRASRWQIAEMMSEFQKNDKSASESTRLTALINFWLSKKRQGQFTEIEDEIKKCDLSASTRRYQMARFSLINDSISFFRMADAALSGGDLTLAELRAFPIFEEMRGDAAFAKYLPTG